MYLLFFAGLLFYCAKLENAKQMPNMSFTQMLLNKNAWQMVCLISVGSVSFTNAPLLQVLPRFADWLND